MAGLDTCFIKHKTSPADRKIIKELVQEEGGKFKALEVFRADIVQDIADLRKTVINPALKEAGIDPNPKPEPKAKEVKPVEPAKKPVVEKVEEKPTAIVDFIKSSAEPFVKAIQSTTNKLANVVGKTVADLISIRSNNKGIHKIPDDVFKSETLLTKALVDLGVTEDSSKILVNAWRNFAANYNKISVGIDTEKGAFAVRHPFTMLFRTNDGRIPPQILFSMMVNAQNWVLENPHSNVFMSDTAQQRFLYGTQDQGDLTQDEKDQLKDLGHSWKLITNMLGKSIVSMLNMSAKDKESKLFFDNLVTALGMAAIEISHNAGDKKNLETLTLHTNKVFKFDEDNKEGRTFNTGDRFHHITTEKTLKKADKEKTSIAFTEAMSVLNKNGEIDTQIPLQKAPNSVVNFIRNSFGGVPVKVANALRKVQQVPWGKNETMPLFEALAEADINVIYKLAKLKDVHKDTSHVNWKKHAESSNQNKIDNITAILEHSKEGNLDNFYFKYKLMNQHRIMMDGHINPQNSKVARAVLTPKTTSEVYTKENIHLFKLAVLSNLGIKLHQATPREIPDLFDSVMDDPLIQEAVDAMEKNNNKRIGELAIAVQDKYGGDISVLTALTAISKYFPFGGGDVKSFSSDITIEADGITNGFAMTIFQFPVFDMQTLEKFMNQTGTYIGKTAEDTTHLVSGIYKDPANALSDVYYNLEEKVFAAAGLDTAQTYYENDSPAFSDMYEKASAALDVVFAPLREDEPRDFVKYPFITNQYGAGIASITESIAEEVVLEMYKRIGEMQAEYNKLTDAAKAEYIELTVAPYQQHLENLRVKFIGTTLVNAITNPKIDSRKIVFNETLVLNRIAKVLAPRFDIGLTSLLGDTKDSRDAVTKAVEVINTVFNVHLEEEIAKREAVGNPMSPSEITDLVKTTLIKWLPQYKGPLMSLNEKAFIDLSKSVVDSSKRGAKNKDSVTFSYKDKNKVHTRNSNPNSRKFVNPGVSALIRLIINMDSSLMTASLNIEPNLLTLYDAVIGSPSKVARFSKVYGQKYIEFGLSHSVMQNVTDQMNQVLADTKAQDTANGTKLINKVRAKLKQEGFRNTGEPSVSLEDSVRIVQRENTRVAAARTVLRERISQEGAVSHQMFIANIAATNPAAARSFNERSADIMHALLAKQREIFFSLAPVKAFSAPVKRAMTALFQDRGTGSALGTLKEYTPENAFDYIKIAKADASNTNLVQALSIFKKLLTVEDSISPDSLLAIFLQTDPAILDNPASNQIIINEFISKVGESRIDQFRQNIIDELELYSVAPNFAESTATFNREMEDLKRDLLSLNDLPRENPETVASYVINTSNITKLFKQFTSLSGNYYNSVEAKEFHTKVLQDLVTMLGKGIDTAADIELTTEEIDGITQGSYDKARENIRVSMSRQPPAAANGQSPQEVYVHELLHALTAHALDQNPLIGKRVEKAYAHIKSLIDAQGKHTVFLQEIANPTDADIEMAKRQYNYVFDNTKNEENRLAEFLAYATTNKAMVSFLQRQRTPLPVRADNLIGWLRSLVDLVVDGFTRMLRRATGNNTHQDMVGVVEQLIEIQQVHEGRAKRLFRNYAKVTDKYDERIREIYAKVKDKSANSATAENLGILTKVTLDNLKAHMSTNAVSAVILRSIHNAFITALISIAKELGEGVLTKALVNQLMQVKNNISKQNQILERDMIGWFNDIWKAPDAVKNMTVEEQEGLTDVFLRTELSSLLGTEDRPLLSPMQIGQLLQNPSLIQSNLDKLIQLMNLPANHRALIFAGELGNYMATTTTHVSNAHQNVATIAKDELTAEQNKDKQLLEYLKAYASLVALQNTDRRTIELIKPLVDAEFIADSADNAIIDILKYHRRFTETSLKALFDGNPMQTRQGWLIERVDNLTDMVTGTAAQAAEMKKAGYTEPYKLGKIPGVSSAHDTIYVGRNIPEQRIVSGILSLTGKHTAGTVISDILKKNPDFQKSNGSPDTVKIRKQIARMARSQHIKAQALKQDPNTTLRPVRDDKGRIVDYRVEMSLESRKRLLNPDTAFQNVFAHMHSNASNKQQTIIADKDTIDLLVHEQVNLMPKMPDGSFVDILAPNSPFSRDRYWRLPKEVRLYMNQYAINGEFKVRADIIDKVFGFPAKDIGNLEMLQGPARGHWRWAARMGQHMVQTVVSYGVDRIVIGTGSVIAGNLMSNMYALMMRKISPNYIAHKTNEGYQEYQRYQQDSAAMRKLRREIEAKNLPSTSEEQKEFFRAKTRLENNRLHKMSAAGLDSIIVEDLNEASSSGYFSRYSRILKREENKAVRDAIPKKLVEIGKVAFMTKSSAPYRGAKHVVQLSDFLARYVMIEHAMEVKGQSFDTASFEAVKAFVLFDENITPGLDALNSVAGTLFVSYWMRNQRAARALIKNSPTSVLTAAGVQHSTDLDALASINSSFYGLDYSPNIFQGENVLDKVTEVTLLEQLF